MRNIFNLSHLAHIVGHIGRLQTITVIPVVAGDALKLSLSGILRLATTRKEIVSECQIDICAFYVPHRHVYGAQWVEIINEGLQADDVLPAGPAAPADARDPFYLGIKQCDANLNLALVRGYNQIYRRYFAVPTTVANDTWTFTNEDFYPNTQSEDHKNHRKYGALAARLPHILNGGTMVNSINAAGNDRLYEQEDWGVDLPVSGATAVLDIRDLAQVQSRYKSIQEQNYMATFYSDVLSRKWPTRKVNTDADQRPTYLGRNTTFISGSDVNGTDDATLGSYVGKTLDRISFNMPRRTFPEHGNVWVMILPRYPLVHTKEQHPLLARAVPDNKLLLADPTVWKGEPVVAFDPSNWMAGGSSLVANVDNIQQPYGQEYRYQPNRIHPVFEEIQGYPFTQWDSASALPWYYYRDNEYFNTFQTSQIAQWQAHMKVDCDRYTSVVDPKSSIFAGA